MKNAFSEQLSREDRNKKEQDIRKIYQNMRRNILLYFSTFLSS